ncbi:hypothetical protein HPB52_001020 [Rhipicephalus sanguineus]|uniref:Reverse transcriptase zinc-binding domain-containing protein n=1 Tax=Rhipicephalus sanguineus TaxID=34632 RepID=A0A9D4PBJ2_RHISA|nr:hypothetical protein HPB52_001020 [Rhipicephalus sanguineus]
MPRLRRTCSARRMRPLFVLFFIAVESPSTDDSVTSNASHAASSSSANPPTIEESSSTADGNVHIEDSDSSSSETRLQIDEDATPSDVSQESVDVLVPPSVRSSSIKRHRVSSSDSETHSRDRSPLRTPTRPRKPRASAQPRSRGGFAFPDVAVTASILSLRTLLRVLNNDGTPAQTLARYHLGPSLRVLVPAGPFNCGPQSSHLPTVYRALLAFHRRLETTCPEIDVAEAKVVDTMAALVQPLVPRHRQAVMSRPWKHMTAAALPGHLRDFVWRWGWGLLPTRDRLQRWQVVRSATCPNCVMVETNRHATIECVVARLFWRAVHAGFRGQGVRGFVSGGGFPRGHFAALLLVAGLFSLWRNRCEAVAGNCRRRALWPILGRMRREILAFLSEELFFLGEREFLRHWSCPFVGVEPRGSRYDCDASDRFFLGDGIPPTQKHNKTPRRLSFVYYATPYRGERTAKAVPLIEAPMCEGNGRRQRRR